MGRQRKRRGINHRGAASWAAFLASAFLVATFVVPVAAEGAANGFEKSATDGLSSALEDLVAHSGQQSQIEVIDGAVTVEILHDLADAVLIQELVALEATPLGSVPGWLMLARVRVEALDQIAQVPGVQFVRRPLQVSLPAPIRAAAGAAGFSSLVVGEEVAKTNAEAWHAAGFDGAGVRVGIIDGFGLDAWSAAQSAGEVPAPAGTFCRDEGVTCTTPTAGSDAQHGTAVAEVIHEMAPGAEIFLAQVDTAADLQAAIDWFATKGVTIISRSLAAELDGPGDGTGPVDAVADSAVAKGMAFFNSAGNHAGQIYKGSYWRGTWSDADHDGRLDFSPGVNGLEMACHAAVGGYPFIQGLRWSDWQVSGRTDYDLLVYEDSALTTLKAGGIEDQTAGAPPLEHLTHVTPDFGPCVPNDYDYVVVELYDAGSGAAGDTLEIMANRTWFDHFQNPYSASQPVSDSATVGIFSVGAIDPPAGTTIADYSSQGPTNDERVKPTFTSAAGLASFTYGTFPGTSASTPAAAGAAALVVGAGLASTPAQLNDWLLANAVVDRGTGGADNVYGHGELILPSPPTVTRTITITDPDPGASVQGTVVVTATTTGQVTGVDFLVEGTVIETDSTPGNGWRATWNTMERANGPVELAVRVVDDVSVTDSITVIVDNPVSSGDAVQLTDLPPYADVEAMGTDGPGTHLVYLADAITDGVLELFSVPLTGPPGATVRLNPQLEVGRSVGSFALLEDGTVVFEVLHPAQFGSYAAAGLWVVSSTGGTVSEISRSPIDEGIVNWTVTAGDRLVYAADADVANAVDLYSVGLEEAPHDAVKLTAFSSGGGVTVFRPTPDGSRIVFAAAADVSSPAELFSVPTAGPAGAVIPLNSPLGAFETIENFFVSADGSRVVYEEWDVSLPSEAHFDLFSVPVLGPAAAATPITDTRDGGGSVSWFDWGIGSDSSHVVYIYEDPSQFQLSRLFTVPIDGPPSASIELHVPQATDWGPRAMMLPGDGFLIGDIVLTGFRDGTLDDRDAIRPGQMPDRGGVIRDFTARTTGTERVAYMFDEGIGTDDVLWSVPVTGPASAGVSLNQGDVFRNGMRVRYAPNGDYLLYVADPTSADRFELYSVPAEGPALASVKLNTPLPANGDVWNMRITADGASVVYHADQDTDNVFELYQVPITGPASAGAKINAPLPSGEIVSWFFLTRDGAAAVYAAEHIYAVPLGAGPTAPLCQNIAATIYGTSGPDTLVGTGGPDVIAGLGGDDVIKGLGGDDVICGDAGDDTLLGGPGDDRLFGGAGDDLIRGHAGDDTAYGDAGHDRIQVGPGSDHLHGGPDKDKLWGGNGADRLWGDAGRDQLYGGRDDDALEGGDDTDRIWGDSGNDVLRGDANSDYLYGGIGSDLMYGGDGNDRLFGWDDADQLYGQRGRDQLRGQQGDDLVDGGPHFDWCSIESIRRNCERAI